MNRCFLFVLLLTAALLSVLGWFWLDAPTPNQELLAITAKALDYAEGWKNMGGPPWWTPNFLHGTSLATSLTTIFSSLWLLLWTHLAGWLPGPKIAALLCLFAATLGLYALARRLTGNAWTAAAAATAFLLSTPVYLCIVHVEHMVYVIAFAVIPLVLLSLTALLEKPTRLRGLYFGAAFAMLLLTCAKAAALVLPLVVLYGAVLWLWKQRTWKLPGSALLMALMALVILGLIVTLPAYREMRLATVFELAPLEAWQQVFSLKSNLLWFDREGFLSEGMPPAFSSSFGGNYAGLVPLFLLGVVLILKPSALYASETGFFCRFFIALVLIAHWLSFGPHSVLGGQFAFLDLAQGARDPVIAFSWFLLVIQGWIILRLLPPGMPRRLMLGAALIAIYLIVPGFRLISCLPFYSDIRAPHDFSQIAGVIYLALATGCAAALARNMLPARAPVTALALVACLLAAVDVSPYFRPFFYSPLDRKTFQDFEAAGRFLATAPRPGWVHPISGRYFYLLTPHFAKRGLTSEAFNSYPMQRGMSYLQATSQFSPKFLHPFLNTAGVAYVLIDKNDPVAPPEFLDRFKAVLAPAFENENFLILENTTALAPAFLARSFISGDASLEQASYSGLELENLGVIVLPGTLQTPVSPAGRVGLLKEDGCQLEEKLTPATMRPFLPLTLSSPRGKNYQEIALSPPGQTGWAVVTEAYHPDWRAFSGEHSLPVFPANGALLAVQIEQPNQPVTLRFTPPWWYNGFLLLSAAGWLGLGILAAVPRLPFAPPALKKWLCDPQSLDRGPATILDFPREPIPRSVVVIPTYNETISLPAVLEKVFAVHPTLEVLVVDDNSPDDTGGLVKNHPQFGNRLHLLARTGKRGLGSAYREGFQWAFEKNFDACLEMDADLSHDPADIPRLLAVLEAGADAAIGSRYLGGVRVMNWPESRLFLSTGASRFVRLVTGLPLTDATSGFKALRVAVLRQLDWSQFRAEGYGFQVELHHALWQAGARIVEVPIVFTERRDGETKMSIAIAIEAAWRTIRLSLGNK